MAVINNYFEKLPQIHSCLCELVPVELRCVWEWGAGGGQAGSVGALQFPGKFRLVSGERTLRIF